MLVEDICKNISLLNTLPQLTDKDYQLMWISGFWDAPLSGMLQWQNQYCWFHMVAENDDWNENTWYRKYAVIALTIDQIKKEFQVHHDFQRYVGTHWDRSSIENTPAFIPGKSHLFYEKHNHHIQHLQNFDKNTVVAWLER